MEATPVETAVPGLEPSVVDTGLGGIEATDTDQQPMIFRPESIDHRPLVQPADSPPGPNVLVNPIPGSPVDSLILSSNLEENQKIGLAWEKVIDGVPPPGFDVANQVTILVQTSKGPVRIRPDQLIKNSKTDTYSIVEAKATSTAPFTTNQKKALPELAAGTFGEIRGIKAERLGLESGDIIPIENVYVVRPGEVRVLK